MVNRDIRPLYIKHIKNLHINKLLAITLCKAIIELICDDLIGVQQFYGIWRIYTNSLDARKTILSGFEMKGKQIKVHDENPFDEWFKKSEKIPFKTCFIKLQLLKCNI